MSAPRCYTLAQVLELLQIKISTFNDLKRRGRLPFIEELQPRLGMHARYRADLVDRYLAGQWGTPRSFRSPQRKSA